MKEKIPQSIKKICNKYNIKLTYMRNGKRYKKTEKMLLRQINAKQKIKNKKGGNTHILNCDEIKVKLDLMKDDITSIPQGKNGCVFSYKEDGKDFIIKFLLKNDYDEFMKIYEELIKHKLTDLHPEIIDHGPHYNDIDNYFVIMEKYGKSIKEHMDENPTNIGQIHNQVQEWLKQNIQKLNDRGIYHGDIFTGSSYHPENILIKGNTIKLIDFGDKYGEGVTNPLQYEKDKLEILKKKNLIPPTPKVEKTKSRIHSNSKNPVSKAFDFLND